MSAHPYIICAAIVLALGAFRVIRRTYLAIKAVRAIWGRP